jgi:hypothetical protein
MSVSLPQLISSYDVLKPNFVRISHLVEAKMERFQIFGQFQWDRILISFTLCHGLALQLLK